MPLKSGLLSGVRAARDACPAGRATETEMMALIAAAVAAAAIVVPFARCRMSPLLRFLTGHTLSEQTFS
jgi:hypothetical protein